MVDGDDETGRLVLLVRWLAVVVKQAGGSGPRLDDNVVNFRSRPHRRPPSEGKSPIMVGRK